MKIPTWLALPFYLVVAVLAWIVDQARSAVEWVRGKVHSGPWLWQVFATATTHGLLWTGAMAPGAALGALAIWQGWAPAWLALALPLVGYAEAGTWYRQRETKSVQEAWNAEPRDWKGVLDAVVDYLLPLAMATAALYGVAVAYMALELL